ncbi:MAG: hypothetical protein C0497_06070 [Gemmatimonas sp.]|nr:hypothetical protein [Gemmatimonas sp.]
MGKTHETMSERHAPEHRDAAIQAHGPTAPNATTSVSDGETRRAIEQLRAASAEAAAPLTESHRQMSTAWREIHELLWNESPAYRQQTGETAGQRAVRVIRESLAVQREVAESTKVDGVRGQAIVTLRNRHIPGCGVPPTLPPHETLEYLSYHENMYGEQAILLREAGAANLRLLLADAGWDKEYSIGDDGYPEGLILAECEREWLIAGTAAAFRLPVETVRDGFTTRAFAAAAAMQQLQRDRIARSR